MSADAREKLLARRRRDGVADGAGFEKTFPWALAVNGVVVQEGRVEISEVLRRFEEAARESVELLGKLNATLDARQMKEVASGDGEACWGVGSSGEEGVGRCEAHAS